MGSYLLETAFRFLPFYALAIVYGEIALYCVRARLHHAHAYAAVIVFVTVLVLFYALVPTSWPRENRPITFFLVSAWMFAAPIAATSAMSVAVAKVENILWQHGTLVAVVSGMIFVWPIFALFSVCASGLDCI